MEQKTESAMEKSSPAADMDSNAKEKDAIRVVSVFVGNKTASEAIHSAAVKKILYDKSNIS